METRTPAYYRDLMLLIVENDDEDDEPDISAGARKKQLHDIVNGQGQLIRAIGPVRTITMKQGHLYGNFVRFIYDSPGPCGNQPMMDECPIEVIIYNDGRRIYVVPRFQRAEGGEHGLPSKKKALARWLNLATGMTWDWVGLEFHGWNDGGPWYTYRGSPRERYMAIVDLLTQPEAQQLFAWSNDRAVVFNR